MALITEEPEDLASTNALDDIDDPDLDDDGLSIDRYLAFGTTPRAIPNPPRDGEVVTYKVKVECIGQAHKRRTDGEVRYRSDLEILSVARIDEELPPDFVSKKEEERRAKEAAKKAAKGKGLYDNPDEPTLPMGDDEADEQQAEDKDDGWDDGYPEGRGGDGD